MTNIAPTIESMIDSQVKLMLESDSYYKHFETPLKSAKAIKDEHRQQLQDFLKINDFRLSLENAQNLIREILPELISFKEFEITIKELEQISENFGHFLQNMDEEDYLKPLIFQKAFCLSNKTLLHIYALASQMLKEGNFVAASDLFLLLTTLAPHVPSYWIAQGVCLQALKRYDEAIAVYEVIKVIDPLNPAPLAYLYEIYQNQNEMDKAKYALRDFQNVISNLTNDQRKKWERKIIEYRSNIH